MISSIGIIIMTTTDISRRIPSETTTPMMIMLTSTMRMICRMMKRV
jgi:hypothetical protein